MATLTPQQAAQAIEDIDPLVEPRSVVIFHTEVREEPFTTTISTIGGWKAVLITWDDDHSDYSPEQTGFYAYATEAEAIRDAMHWAEAEQITYQSRSNPQ